jgi:hypothetical protein
MTAGTRRFLVALALAAAGCGGDDEGGPVGPVDRDRDGFSAEVDCDDDDASVFEERQAYRDADRDSHGAGELVTVCSGWTLPAGYVAAAGDCDDADVTAWTDASLYPDADGDGFGAGAQEVRCIGTEAEPSGWAAGAGDCAPDDALAWQDLPYLYRDRDGDGATVSSLGVLCTGARLPAGYSNDPQGVDCDDGNAARWSRLWGHRDADGDGRGAGPNELVCSGDALPPGWSSYGDDCDPGSASAWQLLAVTYRDQDGDGATVWVGGSICTGWSLPSDYRLWSSGSDCDDTDRTVEVSVTAYPDTDGDDVGANPVEYLCTATGAIPAGYAASWTDCAPADATAWRSHDYWYRDADGDGRTVWGRGTACIGASVPAGYPSSGSGNDCDDSDASVHTSVYAWADTDDDGFGAGTGQAFCTAGAAPSGFVTSGTDCAPDDAQLWQKVNGVQLDRDGDGYTRPESAVQCIGAALPDPWRAAASGNDCDDADTALWRWVVLYPDDDGDGVGTPPREVMCLGETIPAGWSPYGWDPDDVNAAVWEDGERTAGKLWLP